MAMVGADESDRACWYSRDAIDNGARPSALSLVQDFQRLRPVM